MAKAWKCDAILLDRQRHLEEDLEGTLHTAAKEVGLDVARYRSGFKRSCSSSNGYSGRRCADAKALGFVGTPYFLVNDMVIRGALPLDNFIDAVELALKHVLQNKSYDNGFQSRDLRISVGFDSVWQP